MNRSVERSDKFAADAVFDKIKKKPLNICETQQYY